MVLRLFLFLMIAIVASAAVGLLVFKLVEGRETAAIPHAGQATVQQQTYARVEVLTAARELVVGDFIASEDMAWVTWPADAVIEGMVVRDDADETTVIGSVVRRATSEGEPLVRRAFLRPGDGGFLSAVLSPGKRAVTVNVNSSSGNAGFVLPGDLVDLVLTHRVDSNNDGTTRLVSETLQRGLKVLAIDQSLDSSRTAQPAKTVTLEVDKRQAEHVILAEQLGQITLVLQSIVGMQDSDPVSSSLRKNAGLLSPPSLPEPGGSWDYEVSPALSGRDTSSPSTVTILRGSGTSKTTFDAPSSEKNERSLDFLMQGNMREFE